MTDNLRRERWCAGIGGSIPLGVARGSSPRPVAFSSCPDCDGLGADYGDHGLETCPTCNGHGDIPREQEETGDGE